MKNNISFSLCMILGLIACIIMGYFTKQSDFSPIIISYGLLGIGYACVLFQKEKTPIQLALGIAILYRLVFLFALPPLSDDYFRFIWDGYCNLNGINPYALKPNEFADLGLLVSPYTELYEHLNSKGYYSVYPPILQACFSLSAGLSSSILGSVIVLRSILLAAEIGSLFFLKKILQQLQLPKWQVLLYALNPLVIVELTGNLHFEGLMIFGLLGAIYFLLSHKWIPSALMMGLAIGTKLLPLICLPFLLRKIGFIKTARYSIIAIGTAILSFYMLWDEMLIHNFFTSIRLYYKSFEFNGSLYYIGRYIGYQVRGYNEIATVGPLLASVSTLSIVSLALFYKAKHLKAIPLLVLFAWSIYQLCATTVHPWYITPLVAFSAISPFRYAIIWSCLILCTYINYSYPVYHENLWIVGLEYIFVVGFFLHELRKPKTRK